MKDGFIIEIDENGKKRKKKKKRIVKQKPKQSEQNKQEVATLTPEIEVQIQNKLSSAIHSLALIGAIPQGEEDFITPHIPVTNSSCSSTNSDSSQQHSPSLFHSTRFDDSSRVVLSIKRIVNENNTLRRALEQQTS